MSIFDKLKSTAKQAVNSAAQSIGSKQETFTFTSLPESLAQMQAHMQQIKASVPRC